MAAALMSDGMELMRMARVIEAIRAKHDFVYMMLYSSENIAEREHYNRHIAARVLAFLGVAPDNLNNSVAACMREYVGEDLPAAPACESGKIPNVAREHIRNTWRTACTAILTTAKNSYAELPICRKRVQDALLFMALVHYPDFMKWLRECDSTAYSDDVAVLNPGALFNFANRIARPSIDSFMNGMMSFADMVEHLTGSYVMYVGVYDPDAPTDDADFMPDVPSDYQMCPD